MSDKKKNKQGVSLRSEIANKLLALSEQSVDYQVSAALTKLEQQILLEPAGPPDHPRCRELMKMLEDAPDILSQENRQSNLNYVDRLRQGMVLWHQANVQKGEKCMGWDVFSKKAREKKKQDILIEKLKNNVFELEQRSLRLKTNIEKLEAQRAELTKKATGEEPGSPLYKMAKSNYDMLSGKLKNFVFEFTAVQNVLETNSSYLESLISARNLDDLGSFLPVGMEKMEGDLENINVHIEELVDKLNDSAQARKLAQENRNNAFSDLVTDGTESDFDKSVHDMAESQSVFNHLEDAKKEEVLAAQSVPLGATLIEENEQESIKHEEVKP